MGDIDLELILVILVLVSGLIILFNKFLKHKRKSANKVSKRDSLIVDYAKSFFPVLLFVLLIRSFVAEPFRIPSGSMIPTLEIGDFVLVKKYSYGVRLPVIKTKVMDVGKPQRGDVVVFRPPHKQHENYIKRLIGLPGDHIKWTQDKHLIINGIEVTSKVTGQYPTKSRTGVTLLVDKLEETLPDDEPHAVISFSPFSKPGEWDVPQGHYFMMGDNRDNSSDSRVWKFVPEENLVGKATFVWLHWNWFEGGDGFQYSRIGTSID